MSEISEQYRRLSDEFANKIAKVPDDKWRAPSPCPDWTARAGVASVKIAGKIAAFFTWLRFWSANRSAFLCARETCILQSGR